MQKHRCLTLISYKIKEPNFTIQKINVLIAAISEIKCDLIPAPWWFLWWPPVIQEYIVIMLHLIKILLLSTIYRLQTKKQTKTLKIQMKGLYVRFHWFSKRSRSESHVPKLWHKSPQEHKVTLKHLGWFYQKCEQRMSESRVLVPPLRRQEPRAMDRCCLWKLRTAVKSALHGTKLSGGLQLLRAEWTLCSSDR